MRSNQLAAGMLSAGSSTASASSSPVSDSSYSSPNLYHSLSQSKELAAIVSNLDNYVPLGCLCFEDFVQRDDFAEPQVWRDVVSLPFVDLDGATSSNLSLLQRHDWIRLQSAYSRLSPHWLIFRVYLLCSDVGLSFLKRDDSRLKNAVRGLLDELDPSPETWNGDHVLGIEREFFDKWAKLEEGNPSLFYVFNKLPSPSPHAAAIPEKYAREALEDLLDPNFQPFGLKTKLYPYQRRSAGQMLQREATSNLQLDPRLEEREAPDGSKFYYDPRETAFYRAPRFYEACRGGILAETMGLGKTVVCLALILATKHHPPAVPVQYATTPIRPSVGSLSSMAVSAINAHSVPWRVELARIQHHGGIDLVNCVSRLSNEPPVYDVPNVPQRWNRTTTVRPPRRMILTSTTVIVVPQNLCEQWVSELAKHVEKDGLSVLVMQNAKQPIPSPEKLRTHDVILFTRNRFQMEIKHGADERGRRPNTLICRCTYKGATRQRDCTCLREDMIYESPLKSLHFKRIIVDEGHAFSNSSNNAALVAEQLIAADHRWVVSGTPAKNLLGVELDLSAPNTTYDDSNNVKDYRDALLDQRHDFPDSDKKGAIDSLESLASKFLKVQPWCELGVSWKAYMFRNEDYRRQTFTGFSACLRRTLESLVVKTRPEDVERDIALPPLSHEIVRLEPSFYDKLTANLFTLVLQANAVTSERTDRDYLFHKDSAKARQQLVSNLRQSSFTWTGFSQHDVKASIKNSRSYLEKEATLATADDRALLAETLRSTQDILDSKGWAAMSTSHELGMFIESWPESSAEHWTFDGCTSPVMTGISQLLEAQKFVNERLGDTDPGDGLAGLGIKALMPVKYHKDEEVEAVEQKPRSTKSVLIKGIPTSSIEGEPSLRRRTSSSGTGSPKKTSKPRAKHKKEATTTSAGRTRDRSEYEKDCDLALDSPYSGSRVVGTTSAKMAYLISQILKHCETEKILVFYQGDNIAYYIAQVLELFHVRHEIYAKSLAQHLKARYVVRFDQEPDERVLLMDVSQAAEGLNLSSASRIYFVNPVCRPDVEAQAIKRAHRIGQKRPVYVETLVLKDSIEEKMLERSRRMTRAEHLDVKAIEDDNGIREIIQSARVVPVQDSEKTGNGQMARLERGERLWARSGWREELRSPKRPRATFEDVTDLDLVEERMITDDHDTDHPQVLVTRTNAFDNSSTKQDSPFRSTKSHTHFLPPMPVDHS